MYVKSREQDGKVTGPAVDDRLCRMQSVLVGLLCNCLYDGRAPSLSGSWVRPGNCLILKSPDWAPPLVPRLLSGANVPLREKKELPGSP